MKLRRTRWAGHVAPTAVRRMCTGFWWGNQRTRDHLGDPEVDVSRFIKLTLKSVGRKWNGLI